MASKVGLFEPENVFELTKHVFRENKDEPIHSWYHYVEGFSARYLRSRLDMLHEVRSVYDPFAGSGTVPVACSILGIDGYYSEINPFMRLVTESKTNAVREMQGDPDALRKIELFADDIAHRGLDGSVDATNFHMAFPNRDYFEEHHLHQLLRAKDLIQERLSGPAQVLATVALASILVDCSNMTRRADLRRRRPDEYVTRTVDVPKALQTKLVQIVADIRRHGQSLRGVVRLVSENARDTTKFEGTADAIITSPPYPNGTNYFRNTKLELWFAGFISSEKDLSAYRKQTVVGGINDVYSEATKTQPNVPRSVVAVADEVAAVAYDRRIPLLITQYFETMSEALISMLGVIRRGGEMYLDLGDSYYAGVHVPAAELMVDVATSVGWEFVDKALLRVRKSRNLRRAAQWELHFRKP